MPKQGKPVATTNPTKIQAKILTVKTEHPDLTVREIAAVAETSHSYVVETLQKFGVEQQDVKNYTDNRANVFAAMQYRLLANTTDDEIKKASIAQRVLAACQLYTNERLERGQSTSNASIQVGLSEGLQSSVDKIVSRATDSIAQITIPKVVEQNTSNTIKDLETNV